MDKKSELKGKTVGNYRYLFGKKDIKQENENADRDNQQKQIHY